MHLTRIGDARRESRAGAAGALAGCLRNTRAVAGARHVHDRAGSESGQALVEFSLILFPFLILIAAVIQFGVGITFWQDQQRLAAQGARIAITNCGTAPAWCSPTLREHLATQTLSNGNRPDVTVCFTSKSEGTGTAMRAVPGDGVRVELETPFTFVPILGLGTITLSAKSTMRMEQRADHAGIVGAPLCS